jgi:hypothetical protein
MTGWECPRCHRCYGPFVSVCGACLEEAQRKSIVTTTFTTYGGRDICFTCGRDRHSAPGSGCPMGSHYGNYCVVQ